MRAILTRIRGVAIAVAALIVVVAAWSIAVRMARLPPILLPGPGDVWAATINDLSTLAAAAWSTLSEILLAAVLAIAGGFITAAVLSILPAVRRAVFPYILMTQVVPKVALAPILIAWFGTGMQSRLILAFLIAYFPMVVNTLTGLLGTSDTMIRYARSLSSSEWQTLLKVRLPAALPSIMGGVKITSAVSVIGIVVGEFVATDDGLGKVIIESVALLDTALTISATIVIALIGMIVLAAAELVERRVIYWNKIQ